MSTTVAFIAECQCSATLDEQRACLNPGDHVVVAGKKGFTELVSLLSDSGVKLQAGDRVKLYDLSCIKVSTMTLVATISKMLRAGVAFEIVSSGIVIEPTADDEVRAMLDALDAHYRYLHGIKIHHPDRKGRRRILGPDQLPMIREELEKPGATATNVAQKVGVARSTLFNFLERYDQDRRPRRDRTVGQAGSEQLTDSAPALSQENSAATDPAARFDAAAPR